MWGFFYGKEPDIKAQSVTEALPSISKIFKLVGQIPVYRSHEEYILPVKRCIEGIRRHATLSITQLVILVNFPRECYKISKPSSDEVIHEAADLTLIAYYYLIWVVKCIQTHMVKRNGALVRATRTKQFRVRDVGFSKIENYLTHELPLKSCWKYSATLKITNQKNGRMGHTIHHDSFDSSHSPVKDVVWRVYYI